MKKKLLSFIIVLLASFLIGTTTTYAHVLKSDGQIGAIIHIDPEDDPIINQPAYFFFEFKDKQNTFMISDCDCMLNIVKNNQVSSSSMLIPSDTSTGASASYTFPEKGIYTVEISGKSHSGKFDPFKLTYDFRIERTTQNTLNKSAIPTGAFEILAIGGIIIIFLILLYFDKLKSKLKTNKLKPPKDSTLILAALLISSITLLNLFHYTHIYKQKHSHSQTQHSAMDSQPCCMPQSEVTLPELAFLPMKLNIAIAHLTDITHEELDKLILLQNKSPPA
jgi:hypothetical protein